MLPKDLSIVIGEATTGKRVVPRTDPIIPDMHKDVYQSMGSSNDAEENSALINRRPNESLFHPPQCPPMGRRNPVEKGRESCKVTMVIQELGSQYGVSVGTQEQ